mmetsp:Transcript_31964/g.96235  ORF Transcript_31964/g.96235 Transcript_31964/m.96235 type:complete len:601 (+) Transcript_31964:230-2032(+)
MDVEGDPPAEAGPAEDPEEDSGHSAAPMAVEAVEAAPAGTPQAAVATPRPPKRSVYNSYRDVDDDDDDDDDDYDDDDDDDCYHDDLVERPSKQRRVDTGDAVPTHMYWTLRDTRMGAVVFYLPTRYDQIRGLSCGAYGVVAAARDRRTGTMVAIKKVECKENRYRDPHNNKILAKMTYREIKILTELQMQWTVDCLAYAEKFPTFDSQGKRQHDNIVELLDCFFESNAPGCFDIYMVFEYAGDDLGTWLKNWRRTGTKITEEHCLFIAYSILRGITYLHSAGIIHRDLKPQNIALSPTLEVKVLDFGLARLPGDRDRDRERSSTSINMVVTQWYRAPEVIMRHMGVHIEWSQAIDMWAYGCIFAELFDQVEAELFKGVANSNRSQLNVILTRLGWPRDAFPELAAETAEDVRAVFELAAPEAHSYSRAISEHPRFSEKVRPPDEPSEQAIRLGLDFIDKLICFDPNARLTAADAIDHDYFKVMFPSSKGGMLSYYEPTDHPVAAHKFDDAFEDQSHLAEEWYAMTREDINGFTHWLVIADLVDEVVDAWLLEVALEVEEEALAEIDEASVAADMAEANGGVAAPALERAAEDDSPEGGAP